VSANLWNGRAEPEGFAALVAAEQADVVAVQELTADQAEALSTALPHGRLDPGTRFEGGGIALARPGRVERLPLHLRDGFRVRLEPGEWPVLDHPLEIVNVHVFAPHASCGAGLLRRWRQIRDLERHLVASAAGNRLGRVVVGDLNSTPLWPVYRRIRRHLDDAAVEVARRRGTWPARTWGPRHAAPRLLRIDHGFVGGVAVEDFRVVPIPGSDHSGIVLDVAAGGRDDVVVAANADDASQDPDAIR
jgi:endonuclease/exonuclease/phosphatase family metal-dependent hydrolase